MNTDVIWKVLFGFPKLSLLVIGGVIIVAVFGCRGVARMARRKKKKEDKNGML